MSKLHKLKAQCGIKNAFNARNGPDTIQILLLTLSLGSKVLIYQEKKGWIGSFKVLDNTDTDITIDMKNGPVTIWNIHMKPYYYHIEESNISYPEIINDLVENPIDKHANKEISMLLAYLKP